MDELPTRMTFFNGLYFASPATRLSNGASSACMAVTSGYECPSLGYPRLGRQCLHLRGEPSNVTFKALRRAPVLYCTAGSVSA